MFESPPDMTETSTARGTARRRRGALRVRGFLRPPAVLLALLLVSAGCATAPGRIAGGEAALPAGETSAAFLDRVSSCVDVTENDAARGVLLLATGEDRCETFRQRVEELRRRDIIPAGWDLRADRAVTKGRLAYMLYQALKVPGGLTLTLAGPSQRYCLRELQYQGFLSPGVFYTPVSGLEFVAALTRADAYQQTGEVPSLIQSSAP